MHSMNVTRVGFTRSISSLCNETFALQNFTMRALTLNKSSSSLTHLPSLSSLLAVSPRSFSTQSPQQTTSMANVANPAEAVLERKAKRVYSAENLATKKVVVHETNSTIDAVSIKVTLAKEIPAESKSIVFFLTEGQVKNFDKQTAVVTAVKKDFPVSDIFSVSQFTGKTNSTITLPGATEGSSVVIVGLGNLNDGLSTSTTHMGLEGLRMAVHTAVKAVKSKKISEVTFVTPSVSISSVEKITLGFGSGVKSQASKSEEIVPAQKAAKEATADQVADLFARVIVTSNHAFDKYWKSESAAEKNPLLTAVTLVSEAQFSTIVTAVNVAESVLMARELGSERADVAHPAYMQKLAEDLAATYSNITVTSIQEAELRAQGYNLITAVGQAAVVPPRLVVLSYTGLEDKNATPIALVGKGITFDTGGLNLKPTGFMEEMHADMCGSAAVISTMRALAVNNTKANVVGVLALAENAIDSKAFKPYDIIESYQGSVLIGNTDAEGRLALADAVTYVQNTYAPTTVFDIATLTGACVIALGEVAAGLFSNDPTLAAEVMSAGASHNERLWSLPILPEHQDDIKGDLADINSTGKTRFGGASTAAAFIEKFILPGVSWAHIDIAGPSNFSSPRQDFPKGISGYGVQTFFNYINKNC